MRPLRILHLEDDPLDAELIAERLREGGVDAEIRRVDAEKAFRRALDEGTDLILADHSLPGFDGFAALRLAKARRPDTPFLFLSGALGEELAIETLKAGATDYVLKQRLERLVPAVRRALHEAENRAERQRAQRALRESERRYRLLFDESPLPLWEQDWSAVRACMDELRRAGVADVRAHFAADPRALRECLGRVRTLETNRASLDLFGAPHKSALLRPLPDLLGESSLGAMADLLGALAEGRTSWRAEGRVRSLRGEARDVILDLSVPAGSEATLARVLVAMTDITARKRAEAALRESERRFRSMADSAPVFIWMTDESGACVYVNRGYAEFVGRPPEAMLGDQWATANAHPDDQPGCRAEFEAAHRDGRPFRIQFRLRRADGEYRTVIGTGVPRPAADGRFAGFIGSVVDVTEIEQAREQLARHRERLEELVEERTSQLAISHQRLRLAERLAAIGTLATGLGHDMGNLLLPIRCRLDAMQARNPPPPEAEDIEAIRQSAEYLQQLTNGLRLLAADPDEGRVAGGETDLHAWWPDVAALFRNALPAGVGLIHEIDPSVPPVAVAAHRLTQAVLNLVNNAGEAMRGRPGHVVVRAEAGPGPGTVRLSVVDEGQGMSEGVRRHAMEPFFTTKTRGLSTGLGLSLVHGIVQAAGGSVAIDSQEGRGTTVTLTLPAATERPDGRAGAAALPEVVVSIADARLRAYVSAMVGSMGLNVRSAAPGDPPAAGVWITEPGAGALEAARQFLEAGDGRRVILYGPATEEWRQLGAREADPSAGPARLREALRAAIFARPGEPGRPVQPASG